MVLCKWGVHSAVWIDPTGGDPAMGGPVQLRVCETCGIELTKAR